MTERAANELALAYVTKNRVMHYGCISKGSWSNCKDVHLGLHSTGFPKGVRPNVWYFTFTQVEPLQDVIIEGGDYVVVVDDETGTCGHFISL
jgi:hypothetical protein